MSTLGNIIYDSIGEDKLELLLADECAQYINDPLGWVMWAFDWNYGDLRGFHGPDEWQRDELIQWGETLRKNNFNGVDPVPAYRSATASGHGIGKSAFVSWCILFIMSTRPYCKGVVTANTGEQLRTKTWSELAKWKDKCIVGHWFELNSGKGSLSLYHKAYPAQWRCDAQTCREENSEAFAGLHAANSSPFYIFDEASGIPSKIWEVAEGGLTDGEPFMFAFGNPTRTDTEFRQIFNRPHIWKLRQVDSRTCARTNKELIAQWAQTYGEDSDFMRVRVKGEFPRAGDTQYLSSFLVESAMNRPLPPYMPNDRLIMGIDVSRGGDDEMVIAWRRGLDARSDPWYVIPGEKTKDSERVSAIIAQKIREHRPDVINVDETGIGGPIIDRLRGMGYKVNGVHFGGSAMDDKSYANRTTEMAANLLEWLKIGGALPNDSTLEKELTWREYSHDRKDRLILEAKRDMKKRLGFSPDRADALFLTFAVHVPPIANRDNAPVGQRGNVNDIDYDPYGGQ